MLKSYFHKKACKELGRALLAAFDFAEGMEHYDNRNFPEAKKLFIQSSNRGNGDAFYMLAQIAKEGLCTQTGKIDHNAVRLHLESSAKAYLDTPQITQIHFAAPLKQYIKTNFENHLIAPQGGEYLKQASDALNTAWEIGGDDVKTAMLDVKIFYETAKAGLEKDKPTLEEEEDKRRARAFEQISERYEDIIEVLEKTINLTKPQPAPMHDASPIGAEAHQPSR